MNGIFTEEWLLANFPPEKTDDFFEALFGGAEDGAYDIALRYAGPKGQEHEFLFELTQRPGKCLACNLTYGLPEVFSRHPVINAKGIAKAAAEALGRDPEKANWTFGPTRELSRECHVVPMLVNVG